ncbi:MtnX-like HAD-IB family phosphatase [Gilliamella sp. Pra-s65]|uniref:MtnX-like HAD-IB family phosphatase n=1 Tax=unclassified Gilliamella TaxID=2685620 RepID=UPI00132A160E|nr:MULTISPECIES: MtnX-like HAD-IB family phosphatase [unclassified Gilliamella]MWN31995.1 MtnX-like HAD-IB family phosphatase [Gilliamella sp. Pra-s60]MWN90429.1 MtnX-like HAD-IB family phosphatase [Gilliamella sp. Pra-s65]MWP29254.1 MtnX-like HAD-IB family phosphatase [Gilliamella sp. Pra-s54]MWP47107.1 MtnX-like HAD-IB family phosphatase [Gilliamella sp. Pas-s27]MWP73472.1 MtnX-like HAD-IB family phosphatase [Gilliamella sp. Pra-s52]
MNTFSSITNTIFHPSYTQHQTPIVLCDFDGTISVKDVTDTLLSHFGQEGCDELEELWVNGKIGSQECMSKQIALMDASLEELNCVLSQIEIDPDFKAFINYAEKNSIPVHVVSDGLDYAIDFILKRHGIENLPIFANKLMHNNVRSWRLEFPYANKGCIKQSGNCKCNHVKKQQHFTQILYVGDGTSDYCVSHNVDFVFAKDKLVNYCEKNKIVHRKITSFADVTDALKQARQTVIPVMMVKE